MTERDAILEGWRRWDDMDWLYTVEKSGRISAVGYAPYVTFFGVPVEPRPNLPPGTIAGDPQR